MRKQHSAWNTDGAGSIRYGTHSLRRTKATLIYRRTKNIRAIQLLLGHTKLESTVRYLGIKVDDALEASASAGPCAWDEFPRGAPASQDSSLPH